MNILKKKRVLKEMTLADVADKAGVSISTVYYAENGMRIGHEAARKIAKALGVGVNEVFKLLGVRRGSSDTGKRSSTT